MQQFLMCFKEIIFRLKLYYIVTTYVVFSVASLYVYGCNMISGTSGMDSTMNKASERSSVVS